MTFQPEQLLAGAVPDQSTGVAWATITAPGFEAPLGWDKTSIETRVDPSQEQGKLGTTLSRSVPLGDDVSLTLQNGVSMTRALPNAAGQAHSWASSQALRFNILPTDTSVSLGADISSIDDKWLRTLSAEQKLFGGPFSVTGSVSETQPARFRRASRPASSTGDQSAAARHRAPQAPGVLPFDAHGEIRRPLQFGALTTISKALAALRPIAWRPQTRRPRSGSSRHQQHAIVRHGVAIIPGLRHAGGDLIGHRAQLDRRAAARSRHPR